MAAADPGRRQGPPRRAVLRRGTGRDDGASALELSLIAPALLLLIFFLVQVGLYFYGRTVAIQAAREGVSVLRLAQTEEIAADIQPDVEQRVVGYASVVGNSGLREPAALSTYDEETGRVSVTVTGTSISLVPLVNFRISQQIFGEVERFEGDEP